MLTTIGVLAVVGGDWAFKVSVFDKVPIVQRLLVAASLAKSV